MARIGFYKDMSHCLLNKQKNLLLSFASALNIFFSFKKTKTKQNEHAKKNELKKTTSILIHDQNNGWSK